MGAMGSDAATASGLDLPALLEAIDQRLARLAGDPATSTIDPPSLRRMPR
jgi:hypothetical protein